MLLDRGLRAPPGDSSAARKRTTGKWFPATGAGMIDPKGVRGAPDRLIPLWHVVRPAVSGFPMEARIAAANVMVNPEMM